MSMEDCEPEKSPRRLFDPEFKFGEKKSPKLIFMKYHSLQRGGDLITTINLTDEPFPIFP